MDFIKQSLQSVSHAVGVFRDNRRASNDCMCRCFIFYMWSTLTKPHVICQDATQPMICKGHHPAQSLRQVISSSVHFGLFQRRVMQCFPKPCVICKHAVCSLSYNAWPFSVSMRCFPKPCVICKHAVCSLSYNAWPFLWVCDAFQNHVSVCSPWSQTLSSHAWALGVVSRGVLCRCN
jgi:hypothetical protein